jgi:hypothetical protein
MVSFHSLLRISSAKSAETKKAMGDIEVCHGLQFEFKYLYRRRADSPFFFIPAPPIHPLQQYHILHSDQV